MHASVIIFVALSKSEFSDIIIPPFQRVQAKTNALDANVSNNAVTDLPFSATNQFFGQWILKKDK